MQCENFLIFFIRFQCDLQKKKRKKGHCANVTEASFSPDFMLISRKKKKVFCLSPASFLRDLCNILERGAVNHTCLRFFVGNKNAEKKCRNSKNLSAKMPEKISHFLR